MSLLQNVSVDELRSRGSIKDSDVLKLRRAFNEDAVISPAEADALFELNDSCPIKDATWHDFFIEAVTDYIVTQAQPEGYIVADNAAWLLDRISADGRVETSTELELLIHVLDRARWAPPSLARFALEQVKAAVLSGTGPTRASQPVDKACISDSEIDLLRRVIFAFGGDGGIAVTRAEADVLIDIDHAIAPEQCPPAFTDLFVKAVANATLNGIGFEVPSRAEALRNDGLVSEVDARGAGALLVDAFGSGSSGSSARLRVGGFLGRIVSGAAGKVWGTYRLRSDEEQAIATLERQRLEIITNEKIEEADAAWLASRLGRDGKLGGNELALLEYLKTESPLLPPALQQLVDRAA